MKNFSDYAKSKRNESRNAETRKAENEASGANANGKFSGDAFEILKSFAGRYEGASEDEMMRAILAEARRSRKNGTLSDDEIDRFVGAITPMLDGAQAKKLKSVAEKIKKV